MIDIQLTDRPLDLQAAVAVVAHSGSGAIATFIGTVRDHTADRQVLHLEFEAYAPMARSEMHEIGTTIQEQYGARIAIHHRTGRLEIGEIPVIIAVSTPHRAAAFAACQYAIDTLKQTVPIWKKEFFEDGSEWVSATP